MLRLDNNKQYSTKKEKLRMKYTDTQEKPDNKKRHEDIYSSS